MFIGVFYHCGHHREQEQSQSSTNVSRICSNRSEHGNWRWSYVLVTSNDGYSHSPSVSVYVHTHAYMVMCTKACMCVYLCVYICAHRCSEFVHALYICACLTDEKLLQTVLSWQEAKLELARGVGGSFLMTTGVWELRWQRFANTMHCSSVCWCMWGSRGNLHLLSDP